MCFSYLYDNTLYTPFVLSFPVRRSWRGLFPRLRCPWDERCVLLLVLPPTQVSVGQEICTLVGPVTVVLDLFVSRGGRVSTKVRGTRTVTEWNRKSSFLSPTSPHHTRAVTSCSRSLSLTCSPAERVTAEAPCLWAGGQGP